ncbi:metaxin-1-like isoform X2 [Stegostoma tigrinum]|uniref:metaxin-1-like isoform X2 n=1 Tax=Stegostoma tigrinum TaxID=3053191 RepID=UPI0028700FF1|nr:metaxin-1-like isoform X2 [Stegostoma tigrinum]
MAAPLELFCWKGDWGLPSVDTESLMVLAYARFSGAPVRVHKLSNPWRSPSGVLPALKTEKDVVSHPLQILAYLRKRKYNADYGLSATQAADTLAFASLIEEKLLPALIYKEARECLTLLSQRLGSLKFFFGDSPSSLDAIVFGHLAPILKAKLPNSKLQQHLRSLDNLCALCTSILGLYFPNDSSDADRSSKKVPRNNSSDSDEDPHKRRSQVLSVLVGLSAMIGYAFLSGILSIQRVSTHNALRQPSPLEDDDVDEGQ